MTTLYKKSHWPQSEGLPISDALVYYLTDPTTSDYCGALEGLQEQLRKVVNFAKVMIYALPEDKQREFMKSLGWEIV